jgi:hypothetical protein
MRFLFLVCFTLIVGVSYAQSSKKKNRRVSQERSSSSLEPYYPQMNHSSSKPSRKSLKKKDASGPSYDAEKVYYARLEELEKARRKTEKEMEKPQYADPLYFGHKHPPKKHAPGKMKFCKVCGIKH